MSLGNFEFVILAVVVVLLGLVIRAAWLGRRRWRPADWARVMGFELTPQNSPMVVAYLVRTRTLQVAGAVIGLLAPIGAALVGRPLPVPFDWGLIDALVGYLVGAVVGELTIKRPRGSVQVASLQPRELRDYLPASLLWGWRAATAAALLLVATFQLLNARAAEPTWMPHPVVIGTTILAVLLSVEVLQRLIVARPQPAADRDVIRADDAIRSASVHALAGAGAALQLIICAVHVMAIGAISESQFVMWALVSAGLACFVMAFASWGYATRPRRRLGWHPRSAPACF